MNKVILVGRLGKDPDVHNAGGTHVAKASLATNESYKDADGNWVDAAEWHNLELWGKLSDRRLRKGQLVTVEGKLRTTKWTDKNGIERWTTAVIVQNVRSLEKAPEPSMNSDQEDVPRGTLSATNSDEGEDLPF